MWTWAYLNKTDSTGTMPGKMSMTWSLIMLLITAVSDVLTHTLTPSPTTEKPLSPRHYHHIDPTTGNKLVCDKCPAGTYVSSHCTEASVRECSPCPDGTFTRGENGVQQCHRCQRRCQAPFVEKTPCTSTTDRLCMCPPGSFSQGGKCQRYTLCPPGWGVRKRGSETEDVRCRSCQRGTFSDVASDVLRCRSHTVCSSLGLTLLIKGTEETDSVCGPTPASSVYVLLGEASVSTVSSTESAYRASTSVSPAAEIQDVAGPVLSSTDAALDADDIPTTTSSSKSSDEDVGLLIAATQDFPKLQNKLSLSPDPQLANQQAMETLSEGKAQGLGYRPIRRGAPRPSTHKHFDINEHLPWMIVLLLLLVLVVIVVCSVKRSSRVLKKGPRQDPSSIMEKAIHKKPSSPAQTKERWIYYSNGQAYLMMFSSLSLTYTVTPLLPQVDLNKLLTAVNVSHCLSPSHKPFESPGVVVEQSPMERTKGFFTDESEPLLRCDSTSSKDSALSRTGSFITKEKKDTVLRQVRLDPCELQPIFDDMLHILNPEELHVIEEIPMAEDKLDCLFEIAGVKSQEASQTLLDSVYCHLPDLL
ncbi:tumor necrosis factor receptor superfamily member 21-like [Sinocyclocheilus grahami]|uniref:tumor necrosis factor receptor superfamily member 21-like n=1 Tax=Sinocyclocheilus grahami TaxID=75366 RepID=UPI0007AC7531|nr:PREDICTED: tumor necrosis factor receptor superfamily member 21-like [Sinocyclocheilus grahami]